MKKIILLLIITLSLLMQSLTSLSYAKETNGYIYDPETYTYKKSDINADNSEYEQDPVAYHNGYTKGYAEGYGEGNKISVREGVAESLSLFIKISFGILSLIIIYLYLKLKKNTKYSKETFKKPIPVHSVQTEDCIITLTTEKHKEYTLRAEIEKTCFSSYSISVDKAVDLHATDGYITTYRLRKIFWNNGGYISFEPDEKTAKTVKNIIIPNTPCSVTDVHGDKYTVLFEHQLYKESSLEQKHLKLEREAIDSFRKNAISEIKKLINKKLNYPYMAEIVADYHKLLNERYATDLLAKQRPAYKASETVRMLSKELHQVEKSEKLLKYQLSIYENVFPWLADFKEFSIDDLEQITSEEHTEQDEITTLRNWLSPTEYNNLSTTEKYQLALERYKKSPKTNWQIGIAFERYVGYLYETRGYKVSYFGATKGLEDLGRDLILSNKDEIIAVQCKYWNKNKTIHEKHIFQLYGTMFALSLDTKKKVKGLFITSTSLSDTAKLYAEKLNIDVQENVDFDKEYPCIKCNISKSTGEKIYHLPFDQQYDRIIIDAAKGEKYVQTVEEAESLGFRRAFRHFS